MTKQEQLVDKFQIEELEKRFEMRKSRMGWTVKVGISESGHTQSL